MHLPLVTGRRKKDLLTTHLHSAEAPRHTRTVDVQDSVAFRSALMCTCHLSFILSLRHMGVRGVTQH